MDIEPIICIFYIIKYPYYSHEAVRLQFHRDHGPALQHLRFDVAGTGIMLTGLVDRVKKEYGFDNLKVVVTGGLSEVVTPWIEADVIRDPNLLMKGLLTIYNKNK